MVQQVLRRALGAVKDQASIGLAIASMNKSKVPALEIAIVKATSHDEFVTVAEKHVREIIDIMSFSKGYASLCVGILARRLRKTKNWIVALKVLLLIHKLLLQDSSVLDSSFDDEMLLASRRMLNLSDFKDASKHPLSGQCSQFVKSYALYVGNWLDCFVLTSQDESLSCSAVQQGSVLVDYDDYRTDYSSYKLDDEGEQSGPGFSSVATDPKVGMLLNRVPVLQHLLEHVLGCSSGVQIPHGLVRSALTLVIRDSFQVYTEVCDGTSTLLDEFFLMVHRDGLKTLAVYSLLAKQANALSQLYDQGRELGICNASEYPSVQHISHEHLVLLDEYLKDSKKTGGGLSPELGKAEKGVGLMGKAAGNAGNAEKGAGYVAGLISNGIVEECKPRSKQQVSENWEEELMKEARKLSGTLSMGRSTSFGLTKAPLMGSFLCTPPRRRAPMLSMSAIPTFGSGETLGFSWRDGGKIGIGSPGSYGKLMNKHPQGYKHLRIR